MDQLKTLPVSLFLLLILGIALYLNHSWIEGMFADGHLYMAFGKNASERGYWLVPHLSKSTYAQFPDHIPFVFILEGLFFKLFNSSYTSARIFSSLFSLGTLGLLYLWGLRRSKELAFWSAFFFLIIPPLIKKTRMPGLDTPLMFFGLSSAFLLFLYLEKKNLRLALGAGFFWGLALLCKGPIAFFIPLGFFFYLLISKEKSFFKFYPSYLIFPTGLVLFGIWPLSLYLWGEGWIFEKYLYSTFIHSALEGRNTQETSFLTYGIFLLKNAPFLLPMAFTGIQLSLKRKWREGKYAFTLFWALFLPLNFLSPKYANYLLPLYPYLALLAGIAMVTFLPSKWSERFIHKIFPFFVLSVLTILLIFPLTNKSKRDVPLQKIVSLVKGLPTPPPQWAVVGEAYPFYNVANLMAYRYRAEVFKVGEDIFKKIIREEDVSHLVDSEWPQQLSPHKWAILVKKRDWEKASSQKATFQILAHFKRGDFFFIIHKSLLRNRPLSF